MPKEKRAIGAKKTRERAASTFQALFSFDVNNGVTEL